MSHCDTADRLAWWREARFGLFIHWGIYSVPAGIWKGEPIPSLGEWIMYNGKISIAEYEQLAGQFNPVKFDADEWVSLAARAGMKYLVITAKHHDGFAMYNSPSSDYDIVDATPYGHDVMAELAAACGKHGLRMCFYYSQAQDWHAPGGAGHWDEVGDAGWWSAAATEEQLVLFARYLEGKVKPQVRELLTQYGPIGLIWFDTPVWISKEQSQELADLVHSLQPDCLVSGRVGHDVGDYGSLGDNQIPAGPVVGEWETPATLNDTWGFKSDDHDWKSVADLLHLLVDLASKGANYLLNVGPTSEGLIPQPSVDLLEQIGQWMDVNGEAIHGSLPSPFPYEFQWGRVTAKGSKLYLLLYEWPAQFRLAGLRNNVLKAYPLADPGCELAVEQSHEDAADRHELTLALPESPTDPLVSVIVLELDGEVDADMAPQQQASGLLSLPAHLAQQHKGEESTMALGSSSVLEGWHDPADWLSWRMKVARPGSFWVRVVVSSPYHGGGVAAGSTVTVAVAGKNVSGPLTCDEEIISPRAQYFPERGTTLGRVRIEKPGEYEVGMRAEEIQEGPGITLAAVELVPVRRAGDPWAATP